MPSEVNLDISPMIQAWADITIKEWIAKIRVLGIHDGALVSSFTNHVIWSAGGDEQKIEFAFAYYGSMVDMGVGNGVTKGMRDTLYISGKSKRRPKEWFSSVFNKQIAVLKHLLRERTGGKIELTIRQHIRKLDPVKIEL